MQRTNLGPLTYGLLCLAGLALVGCGGGSDDDASPGPSAMAHIAIAGTWTSAQFGETDVIDDTSWSSDFGDGPTVVTIVDYSNSERFAVREGPDYFDPSRTVYDRVTWTEPENGSFYYCTVTYGCDTPEQTATGDGDDSEDSPSCNLTEVDASDLDGAGCGGFSWTQLSAP